MLNLARVLTGLTALAGVASLAASVYPGWLNAYFRTSGE